MKEIESPFSRKFLQSGNLLFNDPSTNDIAYLARLLSMISLPYRDPHTTEYERRNGLLSIVISTPSKFGGVPFGKYPRILKIFIENEAFLKKSKTLDIGRSFREFSIKLKIGVGGKQIGSIKKAFTSFSNTSFHISFPFERDGKSGDYTKGFLPIDESLTFWDKKYPDQNSLFEGYITLSDKYYSQIINHPMPIDLRVIDFIKDSALAIDIYTWLTGRFFTLKKGTTITWEMLSMQFGNDYTELRAFKFNFLRELKKVLMVYPEARVRDEKKGILLLPSKPSILVKH